MDEVKKKNPQRYDLVAEDFLGSGSQTEGRTPSTGAKLLQMGVQDGKLIFISKQIFLSVVESWGCDNVNSKGGAADTTHCLPIGNSTDLLYIPALDWL